jgi:hypothetical protein
MLAFVLAGCARKHQGPEAGDSVTNWLHTCAYDGECRGSASCLNHLCTLACSAPAVDACSAIAASAVCKTSTTLACDVPCVTSETCSELGEGYLCRDGYCREGEQEEHVPMSAEPSGEKRSDQLIGEPFESETYHPRGPGFRDDAIVPGRREELALAGVFRLSDRATRASWPQVSWHGDGWIVSWALNFPFGTEPWQSEVATVSRTGLLDTWRTAEPQRSVGTQDEHGRIASVRRTSSQDCELRVTDLARRTSSVMHWRCVGPSDAMVSTGDTGYAGLTVAAIEGSDEWLVTWTALESTQPPAVGIGDDLVILADALMVARYDPDQSGWSAGPWRFPVVMFTSVSGFYAAGGDAWTSTFGPPLGYGQLLRLHDVAQPERVPPSFVPTASLPTTTRVAPRDAFQVGDSTVFLEYTEKKGLQTRTFDVNGTIGTSAEIFDNGVIYHDATALPELGQIAVCVVRAGVSLLILDQNGALQHGPFPIEEDATAPTSGGRQALAASCDLAWSGSELLIVWSTAEVRGPFVQPPGPDAVADERVSGRIVKLTASGLEL